MMTAQFLSVDRSSDLKLEDYIPTGSVSYNDIVIKTLDMYGKATNEYTWDPDWSNEDATKGAWLVIDADGNETKATGVTFAGGTGLWVLGVTGAGLQTSGIVSKNDIAVSLRVGSTATGNPFPVDLSLEEIVVTGSVSYNDVVIKTLDMYGKATAEYTWDPDWSNENNTNGAWLVIDAEGNETKATGVSFAGGEGLWVLGVENAGLQFPAPEGL